jgi:two-component system cell cycle sensor histidine kinase PleC
MAGADTACVSARAGTILGVTRSFASPLYRRLERYEPWLRLAVPAMLAVFLVTLVVCASIQVGESREEALADAVNDIDVIASLAAVKLGAVQANDPAEALDVLVKDLPSAALLRGRTILIADAQSAIQAVYPPAPA